MSPQLSRPVPALVKNPERRLLAEYVAVKFGAYRHMKDQPVGPALTWDDPNITGLKALRASRGWRPEVDAIVVMDGVLLLIEAKVRSPIDGLAKLPLYKALVGTTPELREWASWDVRMRLVLPYVIPWVELTAKEVNIEVDYYVPVWINAYLEHYNRYWSREYREEREAVMRQRALLGL